MIDDVSEQLQKCFQNFKKDLVIKSLNVFVAYKDFPDQSLQADWDNINIILFNLIHNSIKFNFYKGEIFIIISAKKYKRSQYRGINEREMVVRQAIMNMSASNKN